MKYPFKKYFLSGAICAGLGLLFLSPLTYQDLSNTNIVGLFFATCIGATFLYVGIMRIKKSRHVDDFEVKSPADEKNVYHSTSIEVSGKNKLDPEKSTQQA